MEFVKLTSDNIPSGEVIALSYYQDALVGYISDEDGMFVCESEETRLEDVLYYMMIPRINQDGALRK